MISSTGYTAQRHGGLLGQFKYLEDKGYYVQSSTEQRDAKFDAVYLYPDKHDQWHVGPTPVGRGWLHNIIPSKTPPTITGNWLMYYANGPGGGLWTYDDFIYITHGLLNPLPKQCTVTARRDPRPALRRAQAEEYTSFLGVFTRTDRWWRGKPVYVNKNGQLLYHGVNDDGWGIGPKFGNSGLKGSRAHHSPDDEDNWRYWTGSAWVPASVTVKCST